MARGSKIFDPEKAIGHAAGLFEAHDLIKSQLDAAVQSEEGIQGLSQHKVWGYASGAAILGAVALEVHLKALHVKEYGRAPRKHQLWTLYKRLPEHIKNDVEREFDTLAAARMDIAESVRRNLRETLLEANDALEHWRYAYEGPGARYSFNHIKMIHSALLRAGRDESSIGSQG